MVTTESWPGAGSQSSRQARPLPGPGVLSSRTWAALQHRVGAGRLSRWLRGAAASLPSRPSCLRRKQKKTRAPLTSHLPFPLTLKETDSLQGLYEHTKRKTKIIHPNYQHSISHTSLLLISVILVKEIMPNI